MRQIDQPCLTTARICICGCLRSFEPSRPWQKFFDATCRRSDWQNRWRRRKPAQRAQGAPNASRRIPKRVYARTRIEPGSIRKTLERIARCSPEFFIRLADSLKETKSNEAAD